MALTKIDDRGLTTPIDLLDSEKIRFGTGNDLELYHDGTHSRIDNSTGYLTLRSNQISLQNAAGDHDYIKCPTNEQGVELYYDNVKKLQTNSTGIQPFGNVDIQSGGHVYLEDNGKVQIGNSQDLQIYHDGTNARIHNTTGNISCKSSAYYFNNVLGTENCLDIIQNGAVNLYYDNSKKLETTSWGVDIHDTLRTNEILMYDHHKIKLGDDADLEIYHNGSSSYISDVGTGHLILQSNGAGVYIRGVAGEESIKAISNGAVELYNDGSKKFETTSGGINVTGSVTDDGANHDGDVNFYGVSSYNAQWDKSDASLKLLDNAKVKIGTGGDLQLFHDASNSWIKNTTNTLIVASNLLELKNQDGNETYLKGTDNGSVELFYDGSRKFSTNSSGCSTHGHHYFDDNQKVLIGSGSDLQIYHNGSHSYISDLGTGDLRLTGSAIHLQDAGQSENMLKTFQNGAVELYYDNALKLHTHADGVKLNDTTYLPDNKQLIFGGGNDLKIYHDGSASRIDNITGSLILRVNTDEKAISCIPNGSVELYHNNGKVFEAGPNANNVRVSGWLEAFWDQGDAGYVYDGTNYGFHKLQSSTDTWVVVVDNSHNSSPYGIFVKFTDVSPDNNTNSFYAGVDGTGYKFKVYSDGDVWTSDAGTLTSDATLKENITDATSKLEDLKKLKVRNFNWKASFHPEKSKTKQIGFIAQEVEEVFPGLVTEHDISPDSAEKDHTPIMKKSIKAAWDPIIIKAMQELITKVETLETKVAALEGA